MIFFLYRNDKIVRVRPQQIVSIRLLGINMNEVDEILFSSIKHKCVLTPGLEPIDPKHVNSDTLTLKVRFPRELHNYYVCIKPNPPTKEIRRKRSPTTGGTVVVAEVADDNDTFVDVNSTNLPINLEEFIFQGIDQYKMVGTAEAIVEHFLPVPLQVCVRIRLLFFYFNLE